MMLRSAKPGTFEPGAVEHYVTAWSHPGSLTAMLNYYRALRRRPSDGKPARLAPPTLILWAGDHLFLERHVAEAGLTLCDDGRLEFVEGANHWLHLEQPKRITDRVLTFLHTGQ